MFTTSTNVLRDLKNLKKRNKLNRFEVCKVAQKYELTYFFLPDNKGLLKKDNTFLIQFKVTN
jgi:hypothetical protein